MSYRVGDTVGPYTILAEIGSGGMGQVFKVEHSITRRVEAMKVLLHGEAIRPDSAQRFLREIQVQAKLKHPNIAEVHNAFAVGDDLVLVMELVEGESLDKVIERGPVPLATSLDYIRQALAALTYAHGEGVTHRDIKPANMIVTPQGILKLTDFGLAKARGNDVRLTKSGAMVGSMYYAPPEQIQGLPVDERADLYSLGVILYELVTGRPPFEAETAFELMRGHVEQPPPPPIEKTPSVPPSLNELILRSLAKKPQERFQSAADFRQALDGIEKAEPVVSPRRRWRRAALGIALGGLAGAVLVVLTERRPPPQPALVQGPAPTRPSPTAGPSEKKRARTLMVPEGTTIKVKLAKALSTNTERPGELFLAVLQEPLTAGDWAVALKGATVEGRVEDVEKSGRLRGRSWISVRLTRLHVSEGRTVEIVTDPVVTEGGGGRLFLIKPGAPVVLPAGAEMAFRLTRGLSIRRDD